MFRLFHLYSPVSFAIPGIVIVLFFQCVATLLDPANRRKEGIKRWGLIAYTVVMFSFVTVYTAMSSDILSISFIDNRQFPGVGDTLPPGPVGYEYSIYSKAISLVPNIMFLFNNWLADGLLASLFSRSFTQWPNISCYFSCIVAISSME